MTERHLKQSPPLLVRPATLDDVSSIAHIMQKCFDPVEETHWHNQQIKEAISGNHLSVFVIVVSDQMVGFLITQIVVDEAEILLIAIEPERQGVGFASHLLQGWLNAEKQKSRLKKISLEVAEDNMAAIKFYHSAHFEQVGLRKAYYKKANGERTNAMILARRL